MAVAAFLIYVAAAGLSAGQASAGTWDDLAWMYQPSEVVDIHLTLDDAQKAVLNSDAEDREYAGGVGFWMTGSGGRSFGSAGTPWRIEAKLKGHSTFRFLDGKAAFNLKFPKGSRPNALKKMTLNNLVKDPTYLREETTYDVFRASGIPAPRTGYARLWVNDEYYGLYLNLEKYTDQSLEHWFPNTQHLYEAIRTHDIVRSGDLLKQDFEVDEGDEVDWSDLESFAAAVRTGQWAEIQSHLASPEQTIRFLAAEWYLGQWDGYSWSGRNYYLHSDVDGLFTLLPTGTDLALRDPFRDNYDLSFPLASAADSWDQPSGAGAIVDACFADSGCSEQFIQELVNVRQAADGLDLETTLPARAAALTPLIESDPRKEFTMRFVQKWQSAMVPYFNAQDSQVEELLQTQPPPQYSLVVNEIGDGSGSVGANPVGTPLRSGHRCDPHRDPDARVGLRGLDRLRFDQRGWRLCRHHGGGPNGYGRVCDAQAGDHRHQPAQPGQQQPPEGDGNAAERRDAERRQDLHQRQLQRHAGGEAHPRQVHRRRDPGHGPRQLDDDLLGERQAERVDDSMLGSLRLRGGLGPPCPSR